ncbi:MAG: AI-2E family transporter [Pyrinomonadaceae bacterium]
MSKENGNDARRLSELTIGDAKRILVYGTMLVLAAILFALLVGKVIVALLLGVVAGIYLLPVQKWLEARLHARAGSALVTIALIVVPLVVLVGYAWYEMSGYSNLVHEKRVEIINSISSSLAHYLPVSREGTRAGLRVAFTEAITRSAEAIQDLRKGSALLLASLAIFFFTVFYVLTQRERVNAYIKLRVPGEYLPLYDRLVENIGGVLRGVLRAVFIDQFLKGAAILLLNVVFGVPLAVVLAIITFLVGFFPLLGEWTIYIPICIYLLVFRSDPLSAGIYLGVGILMTLASTFIVRPRLAAGSTRQFNFYWMLIGLVAGVYAFGVAGLILGPAILGFVKAVVDTLLGDVRYETSLLKSEGEQLREQAATQLTQERQQAASATD